MTKDEMRQGLMQGRRLVQEEWSKPEEIQAVDELIAEGAAQATPWEYRDGFQCNRRIVTRAKAPTHD